MFTAAAEEVVVAEVGLRADADERIEEELVADAAAATKPFSASWSLSAAGSRARACRAEASRRAGMTTLRALAVLQLHVPGRDVDLHAEQHLDERRAAARCR